MTWGTLVWFGLVLICPLSMMFMMRGMGGMGHGTSSNTPAVQGADDAKERRLADLEREVTELRGAHNEQRFIDARKR